MVRVGQEGIVWAGQEGMVLGESETFFTYAEWRSEAVMVKLHILILTGPPLTCHLQMQVP